MSCSRRWWGRWWTRKCVGEPRQPGRSAGAGERGGGQFPPRRAFAKVAGRCAAARRGTAAATGESRIFGSAVVSAKGGAAAGGTREAATAGTGDRAVAGVETEAGGSGAQGGRWKARAKDPRHGAASEHERCRSAADEDAQRRLQPGVQRTVGD